MASEKWQPATIMRILSNKFYAGTLTLGKSKRRSINGKAIPQPEEKQYVFVNAHEAIIDIPTFNLAQEITKKRENTLIRTFPAIKRPPKL